MFNKFFKKPNNDWVIWMGIFISYIIVGVGVFLWQGSIAKQDRETRNLALIKMEEVLRKSNQAVEESKIKAISKLANPNVIEMSNISVGTILPNGMKVLSLQPLHFSGKVVVKGKYEYSNDRANKNYDTVCFFPQTDYLILLPRLAGSSIVDFCFSNQEIAKLRYGPRGSSGEAEIVIDNYTIMPGGILSVELYKTLEKN